MENLKSDLTPAGGGGLDGKGSVHFTKGKISSSQEH